MSTLATYYMVRKHGMDIYVVIQNGKLIATFLAEFSAMNRCAVINAKLRA
jgi:hypothetical protein